MGEVDIAMFASTDQVSRARQRCQVYRRRILDVSQKIAALHIAPAFSTIEMVDAIYNHLMRYGSDGRSRDTFIMSKGHGYMSQAMVLVEQGILSSTDLDQYCTPEGRLGAHPDYGVPGIEASTGSLGHGLGIAVGMAAADRIRGDDRRVFVVIGDGEAQEGSVWEAIMMAPNLHLANLVVFLDFNDYQGLGRTSETHPHFDPIAEKVRSFGWEVADIDGHDWAGIVNTVQGRQGDRPMFVVCRTIKGQGVSFMQNDPIWHYRSPNKDEYKQAILEIEMAS
jgi:transketolase